MSDIAILGTDGTVLAPDRFDAETLLTRILGNNSGNLIFQHAAAQLFAGRAHYIGLAHRPYLDPAALAGVRTLVFPAANHLRAGSDWTGLCDFLERAECRLIVLGLGAQAPAANAPRAITRICADPQVQRLADILRRRAALITLRGAFTAQVCKALELTGTEVLGCPSLLLNGAEDLGRQVQARLWAVQDRAAGLNTAPPQAHGLRIAMTAAAPFELRAAPLRLALEQRLVALCMAADGLYVQQSGGLNAMLFAAGRRAEVPEAVQASMVAILAPDADRQRFLDWIDRCGRFHISAPDWITEAAGLDLVLGSRLHGAMAALAAGTPGVVISHDSRTEELQHQMHLPTLSAEAVLAARNLEEVLAAIRFDPEAFDAHRAQAMARTKAGIERALNG